MKNIFVVEDETLVRLGIHTLVEELSGQYVVLGEAENGVVAVEQILQLQPDIVLLDITIPGISGIEVLRRIREGNYKGHVMMLTCHEEIQFAQQALRYGADDYVLKTELSGGNLLRYLEKAKCGNPTADLQAAQSTTAKRENFFCNLFMSGLESEEEFQLACTSYQLRLSKRGLYFILVHIRDYVEVRKRYEREEQDMLFTALNTLLKESLGKLSRYEIVRFSPEDHVVLLSMEGEPSSQRIHDTLQLCVQRIHKNIETFLNIEVLTGISREIHHVAAINQEFDQVIRMLDRAFFFHEERTFWHRETRNPDGGEQALGELKQELRDMVDGKAALDPAGAVERFRNRCKQEEIWPDRAAFLYAIHDFSHTMASRTGTEHKNIAPDWSIEQLLHHLTEMQAAYNSTDKPQNYLAAQTMAYVDEHFAQDITLDVIAEKIGVSASYLSRVFAKTVGQNLSAYITEKRVDKAKYLICNTMLKHYEIAEKCGLNSSAYFTSVFKKTTGVTPNQYRNTVERRGAKAKDQ